MIPLIVAAVVVAGMGDRPAAILGADGKDGYLAKLEQKLEMPGLSALIAIAIPDCPDLTYTANDYVELRDQDVGPTDSLYKTLAVKPAVLEHIWVRGCGKQLRLNFVAMRPLSNPTELKFTFQMVGESDANLLLERDTFTYVSIATTSARTLAGIKDPCAQSVMVYNTQVTTPPVNGATWHEVWYTSVCGFKARIAVDYAPDGRGGTTIGAHPLKPEE